MYIHVDYYYYYYYYGMVDGVSVWDDEKETEAETEK
jgi:hypothetical protein